MKSILKIALFSAAVVGFAASASAQQLSIATGGTGGVYYPLGGCFMPSSPVPIDALYGAT